MISPLASVRIHNLRKEIEKLNLVRPIFKRCTDFDLELSFLDMRNVNEIIHEGIKERQ